MKKITFLFVIAACTSSISYGMDKNDIENILNTSNITFSTREKTFEKKIEEDIDMFKTIKKKFDEKNSNEMLNTQKIKPSPNSIGLLSFFVNFVLGLGTEAFKASKPVRAGIFLVTNAGLGAWYYKNYVSYKLKECNSKLTKDTVEWHPYSFGSHLIGGIMGGGFGTGIVMGMRQYAQYQAQQKLIEAEMALKKAQLEYQYSKN